MPTFEIEELQQRAFGVDYHGADNTGATDSTAAFQRAIGTVIAAGGGVVSISAGTYLVGALWANDTVTFRGDGLAATTLLSNGVHAEYGFLYFDSGSEEPAVNAVVVGATSGATGTVLALDSESGTTGAGDQTGRLYLKDISGTFQRNENLNVQGGTDNVSTTASVWQSAIINFWGSGGAEPAFNETSTGGQVAEIKLEGSNASGSGNVNKPASIRLSSWLKQVTVDNGNGTAPSADTQFAFTSETSNYRCHVWTATSISGDWGSGTGTATLWVDFVEGTTGIAGSITVDSDATYPGPEATLTADETLSLYTNNKDGQTATCEVVAQTDAFDRDISGVDYSAQAFGRMAALSHIWIRGLHHGVRTSQDERSLQLENQFIEGCSAGFYVLKNHPLVGDGRIENCVFGGTGQNFFDWQTFTSKLGDCLYGLAGYSERPGLGVVAARSSLAGMVLFGQYYSVVMDDRFTIMGCTLLSGPRQRASLVVTSDDVANNPGGAVCGNFFEAEDEDDQPAIAGLWIKGLAEMPITGNTFQVKQGSRGILIRNPAATNRGGLIGGNYFHLIGGNAIVLDSDSTATGGSSSDQFYYMNISGNMIANRDAPSTQFYSVTFSAMQGELPAVGATVTGATSTETATVEYVHYWRFGTLGSSNVRGVMVLSAPSGNFTVAGENITYGSTGQATLTANPVGGATTNLIEGEPAIIINAAQQGNLMTDNVVYDQSGDIAYGMAAPNLGWVKDNWFKSCIVSLINTSAIETSLTDNLVS